MSHYISDYNCPDCKTEKLNAIDTGTHYYYKCPKCGTEFDECEACGKPEFMCECGGN